MITSLANQRIKYLIELQTKSRTRNKDKLFVAEGLKMFDEAPINLIKEVYVDIITYDKLKEFSKETPLSLLGKVAVKLDECTKNGIFVETVTSDVFKKASDTQTPQGILFIVKKPEYELKDIIGNNMLILEDIQDPGNLGTMVRTGEGAGISGILMTKGCVDIFNPKTVRSTMGSLYRVPFVYTQNLKEDIEYIKKSKTRVYAAHLKGTSMYNDIHYDQNSAFLIGNEGNGLSDEAASYADEYLRIPMEGQLESLNAAVAAAILMYEAKK